MMDLTRSVLLLAERAVYWRKTGRREASRKNSEIAASSEARRRYLVSVWRVEQWNTTRPSAPVRVRPGGSWFA
jgi:hypothetical protein